VKLIVAFTILTLLASFLLCVYFFAFNSDNSDIIDIEDPFDEALFDDGPRQLRTQVDPNQRVLSRQNRALKLEVDRVCSKTDCFADLKFTEADIQHKLDALVGHLLMSGHFQVLIRLFHV
jgi:hypothetical protein